MPNEEGQKVWEERVAQRQEHWPGAGQVPSASS